MIMHVVTFTWKPEVTAEQVADLIAALSRLPAQIPALLQYRYGSDLGLHTGNGDFAVVATVAGEDALRSYLEHPQHQEAVVQYIRPIMAGRTAVQIALEGAQAPVAPIASGDSPA
ncbi:Dabb family protein [Streptomyces sp. NPDC086549]|uniref:Dabb family protein n=1 Tax=Streptomyces sp. NPDC086549 TaxID=3365752 RepID=UPI003810CB4C